MRLVFETKQTKSATEIRQWILENFKINCSVQVHPNNTIIIFPEIIKDKQIIKEIVEWIQSEMEGKLITE